MRDFDTYPHDLAGEPAPAPTQPTEYEIAVGRELVESLADERYEDDDRRLSATPWRLAGAIEEIRAEANEANPARDKTSDGTIGNAAHIAEGWELSDHNPFVVLAGVGVVRAVDLDVDGLDLPTAFERARVAVLEGRLPQLVGGGYLILNQRITAPDFSGWRAYSGVNPHTHHGHVSVSRDPFRFDNRSRFGIFDQEEDQMNAQQAQQLAEVHAVLFAGSNGTPQPKSVYARLSELQGVTYAGTPGTPIDKTLYQRLARVEDGLVEILDRVRTIAPGSGPA